MFDQIRSFAYGLSGKRTQVAGLWERVDDHFAGCVVLVKETEHGLQGQITYVPPAMRRYGWVIGDLKWKGFTSSRLLAYRLRELYKEVDSRTGELRQYRYTEARLGFIDPDEIVVIPLGGSASVRNTRWRRSGTI